MKAYVINLDDRPERMSSFKKNNFPFDVERVSAVKTNDGAVGCMLSHFNILKAQTHFPFVIFEDDCVMVAPWDDVEKAISQLPSDWDALWLGATLDTPLKRYSDNLFRLKKAYCTHAIIYNTQRIVDSILKTFDGFSPTITKQKAIDVFYYEEIQRDFNCFITYPMMALQGEGYSDIMKRTPRDDEYEWRKDCYNKFTK